MIEIADPVRHRLQKIDGQQRVFLDPAKQGALVDLQYPGVADRPHGCRANLFFEQGHFAEEIPGAQECQVLLALAGSLDHFDLA